MTLSKQCGKCGENKPLTDFYVSKNTKDGRQWQCKQCCRKYAKKWYSENTERAQAKHREWASNNPEKIRSQRKRYQEANKDYIREVHKAWRLANSEKCTEYVKRNRPKYKKQSADYMRERRKDPVFHLACQARKCIRKVFDSKGENRAPKTEQLTKCSPKELYLHLLSTWKHRYGSRWCGEKCQIDHIVPLGKAITTEEVEELCHYTNLQLLRPHDHYDKHRLDKRIP